MLSQIFYTSPVVAQNPEVAAWLISRRRQIEQVMDASLGPAAPSAGAPESEVLRRFRTFAASSLHRGEMPEPALDGLRVNERRVVALLGAWAEAAAEVAGGANATVVHSALEPLLKRFRTALRSTGSGRRKSGAARTSRRAVMAAIDRVADGFLAVDSDSGEIVDANPAVGALLGVARDALLGVDSVSFVDATQHSLWWTEIDAMSEGSEARHFSTRLQRAGGEFVHVQCSMTRFTTRGRTLALIVARPV